MVGEERRGIGGGEEDVLATYHFLHMGFREAFDSSIELQVLTAGEEVK